MSQQTQLQSEPVPAPMQIMRHIGNFWTSQCLYAAAKLGLADLLKEGPKTIAQLAKESNTHPSALYRLMRALVSAGLFDMNADGMVNNNAVTEYLRSDNAVSLRWLTIAELGQEHYRGWGNLLASVRTGKIAWDELTGESVWQYYEKNKEDGETFMKAMTGMSENFNMAVVPSYNWSQFKTIVDVGGGNGALLSAILNATDTTAGILFDEPYVISKAAELLKQRGVADRVQTVGGSFFESVPTGADAYVMKFILHDWNDEKSKAILNNIHKSAPANATLLIVEGVISAGNDPEFGKLLDVDMLVMTGGMERTEAEFRALLASAGWELKKIHPTPSPMNIIEATKK